MISKKDLSVHKRILPHSPRQLNGELSAQGDIGTRDIICMMKRGLLQLDEVSNINDLHHLKELTRIHI